MTRDRQVNRTRVEQLTPEPDEDTTYKEATTVTHDEDPREPGPPQESGTMDPHGPEDPRR